MLVADIFATHLFAISFCVLCTPSRLIVSLYALSPDFAAFGR
jgi:hypothetical protein